MTRRYPETPRQRITSFVEQTPTEGALAAAGFVIAWPNGEVWTHDHIAQELPNVNTERAV